MPLRREQSLSLPAIEPRFLGSPTCNLIAILNELCQRRGIVILICSMNHVNRIVLCSFLWNRRRRRAAWHSSRYGFPDTTCRTNKYWQRHVIRKYSAWRQTLFMRQFCDTEISRTAYIFILQNVFLYVLHCNKSYNIVCDSVNKQGLEYGINSVITL